jgi:hypothetical protein
MKPLVITLFASALIATSAFGGDNGAAQRFQAKFGRYPVQVAQEEPMNCGHDCCRHMQHQMAAAVAAPTASEERFRSKFGRYTPAEEQRLEMAAAPAAQMMMMAFTPAAVPGSEARFKAKFGRYTPAWESNAVELVASTGMMCEHCAKHKA